MILPFQALSAGERDMGLVVAVVIGFAFGFVLERAGFGRAPKLAAQFYGTDLTMLKVMFSAIVTAVLGSVILSGLGILDLPAVAHAATSRFLVWPMIVGGFLLGIGFVVSGYCPGTCLVAAASGKADGLAAAVGVIGGTLAYGEAMSWGSFAALARSGDAGQVFLTDLLGVRAPVVAAAVALVAVLCFAVAERLERTFGKAAAPASPAGPRRVVIATFGALAAVALATLAIPAPAPDLVPAAAAPVGGRAPAAPAPGAIPAASEAAPAAAPVAKRRSRVCAD